MNKLPFQCRSMMLHASDQRQAFLRAFAPFVRFYWVIFNEGRQGTNKSIGF